MRIIGGHDYYDSALAYGHDETIVLVREKEKVLTPKEAKALGLAPRFIQLPWEYGHKFKRWNPVAVIIADKFYGGVCFRELGYEPTYAWNQEAFDKLLVAAGEDVERYNVSARTRRRLRRWGRRDEEQLPDYFTPTRTPTAVYDYMVTNRISILVSDPGFHRPTDGGWLVNPDCLKDMSFAKVVDPYTLFQELDMWVSGVLGMPAGNMVEVSNQTKIDKHGFDRFSFRKGKQTG